MMKSYKTKLLLFTVLTFCLGVFSVSTGHALSLSETKKLLPTDGVAADEFFGISISISGDTAVIGAPTNWGRGGSGSAYIYVRDSAGEWNEQQKLTASDAVTGDAFGWSVSMSGDSILIGAWREATNGYESGSAYVFVRDAAGVWREQSKLLPSDGAAGDQFGAAVSLSGDTALITANRDDDSGSWSGSAYVFVRDVTGTWRQKQKLTASDAAAGDRFGLYTSLSGQTAVIGATEDDDGAGSAYMFVRDNTGMWRQQQKITASDRASGDGFGWGLSISGDTVVIGSTHDDDNGSDSGSAYVFIRDIAGVWREQQKLTASDGEQGDRFGVSISISGDAIMIGADADQDNGSYSGSAYVFVHNGAGSWNEQQKLTASDGSAGDAFGWGLAISGKTAIIGSFRDDDNGSESGSAYIFEFSDLSIEKRINHRSRTTTDTAAQLLAGTRYRADYKVTNNSPKRIYNVLVFEGGQLVCNLYALDPGESKRSRRCARNVDVLVGDHNVPASVSARVSGSGQTLSGLTNAYYTGHSNVSGQLKVTHYMNEKNADTKNAAVNVNNKAVVKFRVENTGRVELYRVRLYHDPASPVNSGWQELCFKGTLMPAEVRYCKRTISVTESGLNKAFGRAQGLNANISATGYVNAANPSYYNVVLP